MIEIWVRRGRRPSRESTRCRADRDIEVVGAKPTSCSSLFWRRIFWLSCQVIFSGLWIFWKLKRETWCVFWKLGILRGWHLARGSLAGRLGECPRGSPVRIPHHSRSLDRAWDSALEPGVVA